MGPNKTAAPPRSAPVSASDWSETDPVPAGYHVERRVHRRAVVAGTGLFVFAYTLSMVAGAAGPDARALWVPLGGPFIQLAEGPGRPASRFLDFTPVATVGLVFDAVAQSVGAGMVAYGLLGRERVLVRNPPTISVVPIASGSGGGAVIVGVF
jgi:hypothetical protein